MSSYIIDKQSTRLAYAALWIVGITFLCRLIFAGFVNLLPEEAYYWNYAAHLDIGYLDHPPLSAWLIWLSTSILGDTEFAVRLPVLLAWVVMVIYMFRLSQEMLGPDAAFGCLILLSVLPIYWSVGFLMTPDAALYAAWAATLYYARRAIVEMEARAWWGVGLGAGLGLLAKYTMALTGVSVFAFLLLDKQARKQLLKPGPYLAALLATAIFSPVLWWNYQNDWVSFAFQGSRRWSFPPEIYLHILIGSALILLTPLGLWEAAKAIGRHVRAKSFLDHRQGRFDRNVLFALVFCILPLSVFTVHSLINQTKLNWTGPVWLAVLPWIAEAMLMRPSRSGARIFGLFRRAWRLTIAALVVLYPVGLIWILIGAPGQPANLWYKLPVAWDAFGRAVEQVEDKVENETGREPIIAGLDKYWIASECSFYDCPDDDSLVEFTGRNVIGQNALMWTRWFDPAVLQSRPVILVGFSAGDLEQLAVTYSFATLGPVREQEVTKHSRTIGRFFWRMVSDPVANAYVWRRPDRAPLAEALLIIPGRK